jgi:hypothetical protein
MTEAQQIALSLVATAAANVYTQTPAERRRRWARAGTSVGSASLIEQVADELAASSLDEEITGDVTHLASHVLAGRRLERLLAVTEAPRVAFFDRRAGNRNQLSPSLIDMLTAWLEGAQIDEIGDRFLSDVADVEFRTEQVADLTAGVFESFLHWVLGLVITWANEKRARSPEPPVPIPTDLPVYVRWGVNRPECLTVIGRGIRSRAFCTRSLMNGDGPPLALRLGFRSGRAHSTRFPATHFRPPQPP